MTCRAQRILMTADTIGGVWTYAVELCRGLANVGIQVCLATMGNSLSADQRHQIGSIPGLQLFESTFKLEWMIDPWSDVHSAGTWLLELESRLRPDIIHLNSYSHATLPWRAPVLVVAHSCVLSWWRAVRGTCAPPEWDTYAASVKTGLKAADLVVAPSRAMLQVLFENYGHLARSSVISNGRSAESMEDCPKENVILTAGRVWDEAKNCAALATLARELPWPVCVAGENRAPDGRQLEFENVVSLGRLTPAELAGWYSRAGIYALPARYEPFGLSALEAAHAGCALLLGDIPSLREVWGDAATFVAPDDKEGMRAALLELIASLELRIRRGAMARKAATHYTPERMTASYVAAYEHVLAHHEATRAAAAASLMNSTAPVNGRTVGIHLCE